ncbi:MAG: hypothetical protein IPL61_38560 [Myxococcales bacterium]|nr:hypothetical protein [Myxococcales bacterium]
MSARRHHDRRQGAETADEVKLLTDVGFDLVQGYYFAHPGPAFPSITER